MMVRKTFFALSLVAVTFPSNLVANETFACEVNEGGMSVGYTLILGSDWDQSGITVDSYTNIGEMINGEWVPDAGPISYLSNFRGLRVVNCRTGQFFAIRDDGMDWFVAAYGLPATEFLRETYLNHTAPDFRNVEMAVHALYGDVQLLQETAETCGCANYFPNIRPEGLIPFFERDDVEYQYEVNQ